MNDFSINAQTTEIISMSKLQELQRYCRCAQASFDLTSGNAASNIATKPPKQQRVQHLQPLSPRGAQEICGRLAHRKLLAAMGYG